MSFFSLYHLLFFSLFLFPSNARSSLTLGQYLSGNQTLISENMKFELGFFSPQGTDNSKNYYIGIWYKNLSDQTPLWVGNGDAPVSDPSTTRLTISQDGNLVLLNQSQNPIWATNYTHKPNITSVVAILVDMGNLVIANALNSSDVLWQSFYQPTDTIMIGQWFGLNKLTGENESLTSWRSSEDPGSGPYSLQIDPLGSGQCVLIWNRSKIYWYSGNWAESSFAWMSSMPINANLSYEFINNQFRQQYRYLTFYLILFSLIFRQ